MAEIAFDHVTKEFPGGTVALDDLTLSVPDGEFLILVGPSGCGKTTALRIVAGLEKPTSGVISIGGEPMNGVSPRDRDIAMVFQNYALYPHMTVYRNLAFGLKERHTPKPRDRTPGPRGVLDPRARRAAEAPSGAAVRRPAPAGGDGAGAGPRAEGVPAGRAAVEPGREAPRADARRAQAHPPAPGHHDRLRHARPGRGDDAGRPHRGDVGREGAADRAAAGRVPAPRQPVRRRVHRQPCDEPGARDGVRRWRGRGRAPTSRGRARRRASWRWASGPSA